MTGWRNPFAGSKPAADPEARRAEAALAAARRLAKSPGAPPELLRLVRRRRLKRGARIALAAFLVAATGAVAVGSVVGARAGFFWLRQNTGLFAVQRIEVTGLERLSAEDVARATGVRTGDDILAVSTDSVAARVAGIPVVRIARVRRTWGRELVVTVEERSPQALVLLDRPWEVDAEGVLLSGDSLGRVADLPIVTGLSGEPGTAGRRLAGAGLSGALNLVRTLSRPELGLSGVVSEIQASDPDSLVMILLAGGTPVRVGRGDIPPRRLMAFRAVMDDLTRQGIEAEYLDLRFSGQVVVKRRPQEVGKKPPADRSGAGRLGASTEGRRNGYGLNT